MPQTEFKSGPSELRWDIDSMVGRRHFVPRPRTVTNNMAPSAHGRSTEGQGPLEAQSM
jgi:hypothetical protein